MTHPTILVTGATGKTGHALTTLLLARGWPVRALVRRPDRRSEALAKAGAEVVAGDLFDPRDLRRAMTGTRRAYLVPPFHPHMAEAVLVAADAARTAGLESLVVLSQWLAGPAHPSAASRQCWLIERSVAAVSGLPCTILNPGMFADNVLRIIAYPALLGVYPVLTGDSRSAPVATEDIARVAAAALMDPATHAGRTYRPTGPRLLSGAEMAETIGQVLGRRVRPVPLPFSLFVKAARSQGVDPFELSGYRHYLDDHRQGAFAVDGGVTDAVARVTGEPAESFATTVHRYAARPEAQPTWGNRLAAWAAFLTTPLRPGWDLDRHDRRLRLPLLTHPESAMDSPDWRRSHLIGGAVP